MAAADQPKPLAVGAGGGVVVGRALEFLEWHHWIAGEVDDEGRRPRRGAIDELEWAHRALDDPSRARGRVDERDGGAAGQVDVQAALGHGGHGGRVACARRVLRPAGGPPRPRM